MNKLIALGNITKAPKLETSIGEDGREVKRCFYTLAVKGSGEEFTNFYPCFSYGNRAIFAEKHFKVGDCIAIEGEPMYKTMIDENGMVRPTFFGITIKHHEFAGYPREVKKKETEKTDNLNPKEEEDKWV